ncbi:type II restriction endonuclease (plasmid) [Spiroplasma citri]|uniref:Type II restriction endonuclease n=1 Tax=Spiroplasma citri TaxID=2133 RepID=A0AAJ4JZ72_SPICI|nr:type II restriction endonuclease [Spiroplasma citri]QIA71855.1 type II restriction endonuclease [Spiroplasma citri]
MDLIKKGSEIAKNGFKNEEYVINKFNNWKTDNDAQKWLITMKYNINDIEKVEAVKINGNFKSDIQVKVRIFLKNIIDAQNVSIKLVSNQNGFNQVDKRYVDKYKELWNIPEDVVEILKYFTGEVKKNNKNLRDNRRMFFDEMTNLDQLKLIDFFTLNKIMIIADILKGRGKFSAEWMLVIKKIIIDSVEVMESVLKPINVVLNFFSFGSIKITKQGNLKIGQITMQRKGGDNGRETANMLQFKINPNKLFDLN